jgi:hypothetical protein
LGRSFGPEPLRFQPIAQRRPTDPAVFLNINTFGYLENIADDTALTERSFLLNLLAVQDSFQTFPRDSEFLCDLRVSVDPGSVE